MEDLRELVYLIDQLQHRQPKLKALLLEKGSLMQKLHAGIAKSKFSTDEEAEKYLYPEGGGGGNYRKLKSLFREKLLASVVALDTEAGELTDYQRAYYRCHRQWLVVKILTAHNANNAAVVLATKLLAQTQQYEFTLLAMDISSYLRFHHGLRGSGNKKFEELHAIFHRQKKIYEAESEAEEYYTLLMASYVNSKSADSRIAELASEYYQQIESWLQLYDSYRLHLYGRLLGLVRFSALQLHEQTLLYCADCIDFFRQKQYFAKVPLQIFSYQKLICHLQLQQFEEAETAFAYSIQFLEEGTFNWFKQQELRVQLYYHTAQYGEGSALINTIVSHPRFQFQPGNVKEIWRIFEAYAAFLEEVGKTEGRQNGQFKLSKFVNETPIFSKDKSGLNIAILIIRFLHLLQQRKYNRLLDDLDGIQQYNYRYLKGSNTARSFIFIKFLLQIANSQFDKKEINPKISRLQDELSKIGANFDSQDYELEIIPYEALWEMVVEMLP